jgi:iron(III) transport system substrate-binding protein
VTPGMTSKRACLWSFVPEKLRAGRGCNSLPFVRLMILTFCAALCGCSKSSPPSHSVVLYTSQDQFNAEPILKEFTTATGIEVRTVFDNESAKTAGLARRLRAEQTYPQCDVFWSNEEMHTRLLVRDHVIASNEWRAAGYRTRRVVINTNHVPMARAPNSLLELTNAAWKGRVALAYPLFGTTASHFLALRQHWGEDVWKSWCHGLVRNGSKVVDGNSVVVKLVGAGEAWIGLTDFDDIAAGKKQGWPIAELPLNSESLIIASTIGLVRGGPNPALARGLSDYLSKPETLEKMVNADALEGADVRDLSEKTLPIDWGVSAEEIERINDFLNRVFVRS